MGRFLFVDDEPLMLSALARIMKREPAIASTFVSTPAEALALCREQPPFDVVVSDFMMPLMTGTALLRAVRVSVPHARRVLLTGQACPVALAEGLADGTVERVILKPFERASLLRTLRDLCSQPRVSA